MPDEEGREILEQAGDEAHNWQRPAPHRTFSTSHTDKLDLLVEQGKDTVNVPRRASRPILSSRPTTAVSLADIQTVPAQNESSPRPVLQVVSRRSSHVNLDRIASGAFSDIGDTNSLRSYAQSIDGGGPAESLLGQILSYPVSPAWKALSAQLEIDDPFQRVFGPDQDFNDQFATEFEEIGEVDHDGSNEEILSKKWRSKLKHFFIFSSSGKPIWSRHGVDRLISSHIGVIQTLISSYQNNNDELRSFKTNGCQFVVVSKGHLHLVATSRLGESEIQLADQLESLYMQILSTLTLPSMERMFLNRPSTDLRRPLEGTEKLLDALADGFTRGSPSTLLSSLECLRLRKAHRQIINNALLKSRTTDLLYGLLIADARLVSVVRPKKHSLHPGDLHLIFNMLFEAGSIKADAGEAWIPLCLPGFNNTGFIYMYVSFLDVDLEKTLDPKIRDGKAVEPSLNYRPVSGRENHSQSATQSKIAVVLISTNKEAFDDMRSMRHSLVNRLTMDNAFAFIRHSMLSGRPSIANVIPLTVTGNQAPIRHFLYKSRGNVQFVMPGFEPNFRHAVVRRKLLSLYADLHKCLHERNGKAKVVHRVSRDASALAWETPMFELYIVARPGTEKELLAKAANSVVHWAKREEERIFIIGGAVF